jgi:hypothetical protein
MPPKAFTPEFRVEFAGSTALPSVEVSETVPPKPVAMLLYASKAVTVSENGAPATTDAGAELKASEAAAPAEMLTLFVSGTDAPFTR